MTIGKWFSWSVWIKMSAVFLTILAFGVIAPAIAQPAGCPTGMTGYWKFDESSGGPYDDFFGTNNAICTNCPATVSGKLGNGLDFDGTNDRVDIPDDNSFDWSSTTSFTIEFWMRSTGCGCTTPVGGYTCNQVIAGRAAGGWWIGVNCETGNVGKLRCYFNNADFYSNLSVDDDIWHHVVYQYDNSAGHYRLYIDGSLDRSISAAGANRIGSGPIHLGYYSTAYQYAGLLDEFAVYNQALSLGDIQSHYNSGSGQSYCAGNQGPVVTDIPGETISEGGTFATIALDDYVADADHTDAEMTWSYSGNVDLTVSIDGNRIATITTPVPTWTGSEIITFTATDPLFDTDSDAATFAVLSEGCPEGMIHYWQLNETSAPPYEDSYGSTNATCTNCPSPVAGLIGGAQEFDRLTDLVTVPDDGTFDWTATSDYTIEFWLNKSSGCDGSTQPDNEVVVGRAGGGWWIGVMCEAGANQTRVRAYFGASVDLYSTTSITDGNWHHVAFVRNNTASQWRMYIDGDLEVSQTSAGRSLVASDPLSIGWFNGPDPGKYRLGAILDELALYSSALTEAEIANHYNLGLSGMGYCQLGVPPTFTTSPDTSALGNRNYTYNADATGTPEPTYSLTTNPLGMTIDSLTGMINWTPSATGAYPVSISAINAAGVAVQPYTIIVSALAPLITSTPVTAAVGGEPYEYDVEASAHPEATYFVFGTPPFGLPAGLTFSSTSGLISWPNPQPGSHPISVQAVNIHGSDLQSYVLTVTPVAPLIISSPPVVARTGSLYRYNVVANGSPKPYFYLDIAPSGMMIDSVSGVVTWMPTVAANYPIKIRAANTAGDAAQVFVLSVAEGITECTSTMLHYWRLNELSGPSYANFLTPLTAQCVGACPLAVSGIVDGGQLFGAGNVGLQVADNGSFDWIGIEDFAVEFWMRRDIAPTIDSNEVIVGRWAPQWWIGINHDGAVSEIGKLRISMGGVNLLSGSVVNDDFWHHVVASRSSGTLSLYLDGELQSSAPSTATLAADDPLTMGYLNTSSPILGYLRYKGIIDEVALHSADLPLTVIHAHYNDGLGSRYCARCGDCDANGHLTISDVVALINYIFSGGSAPAPLLIGDPDCSNMVTISDVVYMINFIFSGGSEPCANCK